MALDSSGAIMLVGASGDGSVAIARTIQGNGALDSNFDVDGKLTRPNGAGNAVTLLGDGTVVVAGGLKNGMTTSQNGSLLAIETSGNASSIFAGTDTVMVDVPGGNLKSVNDAVVQPDGKVIVASSSRNAGTLPGLNPTSAVIKRYLADGTLDANFGTAGTVTIDNATADAVVIHPDGKILVAGSIDYSNQQVVRLNSDGSLDTSFGTAGVAAVGMNSIRDLTLQADGKIIVAGLTNFSDFGVARLNQNGSLDDTFDGESGTGDGIVGFDFAGGFDEASSVRLQVDGKIVVAGRVFSGTSDDFGLARLNSDGTLDTTFDGADGNGDGTLLFDIAGATDRPSKLDIAEDGSIFVSGSIYAGSATRDDVALIKTDADGTLDPSFDSDGMFTFSFGFGVNDEGNDVFVHPDGSVTLVGASSATAPGSYPESFNNFLVLQLRPDGSLDSSFDSDGILTVDFGQADTATSIAASPDGSFFVAGLATQLSGAQEIGLIRLALQPDLVVDDSFSVVEDTTLSGDVSTNDSLSGSAVIMINNDATNGTVADGGDGTFVYTPDANFSGNDSFTYSVTDGSQTASGTVFVIVSGEADPATIYGETRTSISSNTTIIISGVVSSFDVDAGDDLFLAQSSVTSTYGLFSLTATGNWTYDLDTSNVMIDNLQEGETKVDVIGVLTADGTLGEITITIFGGADDDTDGVSSTVEAAAGDGNSDGTADNLQSNVTSLPNAVSSTYITVAADANLTNVVAKELPVPASVVAPPVGVSFPTGFVQFSTAPPAAGEATIVKLFFAPSESFNAVYKFGATEDNPAPHYYRFDYDPVTGTGAKFFADHVELHLVDGERGDSDNLANGVIVDPVSLATEKTINSIQIDDDTGQRSLVRSATVNFASRVVLQTGAIEVVPELGVDAIPATVTTLDSQAIVTFADPLTNGHYNLVVYADKVQLSQGPAMVDDHVEKFFRMFGDVGGGGTDGEVADKKINFGDFLKLAQAFGSKVGDPEYDEALNLDQDDEGKINFGDFLELAAISGTTL